MKKCSVFIFNTFSYIFVLFCLSSFELTAIQYDGTLRESDDSSQRAFLMISIIHFYYFNIISLNAFCVNYYGTLNNETYKMC